MIVEYDEWSVCLTNIVLPVSGDLTANNCSRNIEPQIAIKSYEHATKSQTYCLFLDEEGMTKTTIETIVTGLAVSSDSKFGSYKLILKSTIFYPQGGGQPSDVGVIGIDDNVFEVVHVQSGPDGIIEHIGNIKHGSADNFVVNAKVTLNINIQRRLQNTRLHSAGHALDAALYRLGYRDRIKATKGYHFTDGPYVEYEGDLSADEINSLPSKLTEVLDVIISEKLETKVYFLDNEEAARRCGMDLTKYPAIVRVVEVAGFPCPCGGTHVTDTSQLRKVTVTKVKLKNKLIRVSYRLED